MLNKRKLYDVEAPNASTGIINGQSSNVLNWDNTRFSWAFPMYKRMLGNFWTPFEINMNTDSKQYEELSEDERFTFDRIIGLLAFLDSIQTDYSGKVADYLTDSSLVALMQVLSFQEVVHNHSYSYVLSSVTTKAHQDEIFEYWKHDEVLKERNDFIAQAYERFADDPTPKALAESIVYDVILEGLFFYAGFAFFYNLARNKKMVQTSTMINYINRDEEQHVNIFANIFREMLAENPELDTAEMSDFVRDTFRKASELEIKWSEYIIGNRFDGILIDDLADYIKFNANKRVAQLGYKDNLPFDRIGKNPLPWIKAYEDVDLGKSDFFEQKSRQYVKAINNGFDEL